GWHDVTTRLRGPAVADVAAHFAARWSEVTGETLEAPPPPPAAGSHELQVVRTVPEKVYDFLRTATFGSSRPTRARCARRAPLSTSRASSSGRRSLSRSSPRSCAIHRTTIFAWSCSFLPA